MLTAETQAAAIAFLLEIGRWAKTELSERWKLRSAAKDKPIEFSEEAEISGEVAHLLDEAVQRRGETTVIRLLNLIEQKQKLVFEWKQDKLTAEEEYGLGGIRLAVMRRIHDEKDASIRRIMAEIVNDLASINLIVEREVVP